MHSIAKEAALGFKVGISLWVPQPEQSHARSPLASDSDFGAKLGLQNDSSSTPHHEATGLGERTAVLPANLSNKAVQSINEQAGISSSELIELYALGLRAGHHLSRVPHAFIANTLQTDSSASLEQSVIGNKSGSPSALSSTALHYSAVVESVNLNRTQFSVSSSDSEASPVVREWASYLSSQWPERRWLLMKRPDGLELLVRDYHLSHEEQVLLVDELRARIPSSTQPPDRIWLNGRVIWQSDTFPNQDQGITGGHYGR